MIPFHCQLQLNQSLSSGGVRHTLLSTVTNRPRDMHAVKLAIQAQTKRDQDSLLRHRVEHRNVIINILGRRLS